MGFRLEDIYTHPVAQLLLPVAAGVASAYSPAGARATGGALNTMRTGEAMRQSRDKRARDAALAKSIAGFAGDELSPEKQMYLDMAKAGHPGAAMKGLSDIRVRAARPTMADVGTMDKPDIGTTFSGKTRSGVGYSITGKKPEAPETIDITDEYGVKSRYPMDLATGGAVKDAEPVATISQPRASQDWSTKASNARSNINILIRSYAKSLGMNALVNAENPFELLAQAPTTKSQIEEVMSHGDRRMWDRSWDTLRTSSQRLSTEDTSISNLLAAPDRAEGTMVRSAKAGTATRDPVTQPATGMPSGSVAPGPEQPTPDATIAKVLEDGSIVWYIPSTGQYQVANQ